jgi:outer membrane receptor protein involved in Fe transport
MLYRFLSVVVLVAAAGTAALGDAVSYVGRPVYEIIDEFRQAGYPFAYSNALVSDELLVTVEPDSGEPAEIVRQILAPHRLTVRYEAGVYLVIRVAPPEKTAEPVMQVEKPAIESITVSASRYEIGRDVATSRFLIDRRTIQTMPDVGEDPLRAVHRLPGAAASGASAKTHFRGGEESEVGIVLNGQKLFDPFHVRDYQNIFSAIDSRAIGGVEVFTGGFPARYGDRMSGFVLMESMEAERPTHSEIGISVFNTSVLTTGSHDDKRWLFSARRGNLDLVISSEYGEPKYYDVFGEFAFDLTPNATLSINALFADDVVTVVLESEPAEREQVRSDTRNAQFWLHLDNVWSDELSTSTVLSVVAYDNLRDGFMRDPEKIVAAVRDQRDIEEIGLRQDWNWRASDHHLLQWGVQFLHSSANYDYVSSAEYFGLPALYPDQPDRVDRAAIASPNGGSYGAYVADRWKLSPDTVIEWGLRWDDQTYTGLVSDSQLSPRLSLLQKLGGRTELRLSWGRYHQSQGIQELQIEDDVTEFWPAQRADHLIAGIQHRLKNDVALRLELFHKDMRRVRPRFENLYNPLGLIPELQADRVRLEPSSAQADGAEISVSRATDSWHWWASYTWSQATDEIDGRNEYRSWDQRHAVQGGFGWSGASWDLSLAASVHSGWPTTDLSLTQDGVDPGGEPVYVVVPGPRNALRHDDFASIDVRASRRFDVRRGTLSVFLEVSNITDRENVCCIDWDITDDAQGNPALEYSFDYWLPLLPAIGILWEF